MRLAVMSALAALSIGCAPAARQAARDLVRGVEAERPAARAEIPDGEAASFLQRAVTVLQAEGLRVAARSPTQLVTAPREVEGRCGVAACRVRELAMVHVSGSVVRLQIVRAVRSASNGYWQMSLDAAAADETASREARLLQAMLGRARARVEVSLR
jgi:hypothetical protein